MDPQIPNLEAYERIVEEHRLLKALLDQIEQMLQERKALVGEVCTLLGQLGDRLERHAVLEEEEGYFEEALQRAPQLIAAANELMAQHPKLCSLARDLVPDAGAETPDAWWEETGERFGRFKQELLKHERKEDGLLQEAYNRDIGSQD